MTLTSLVCKLYYFGVLSNVHSRLTSLSTDEEKENKIHDLHEKLHSIMLRRLKRDVVKSLPTKTERILRVEMSSMQVRVILHFSVPKICLKDFLYNLIGMVV